MPEDRLGVGKIVFPAQIDKDLRVALDDFSQRVDDNINYLLAENIALKARVAVLEAA
jgi:hypothetical protein